MRRPVSSRKLHLVAGLALAAALCATTVGGATADAKMPKIIDQVMEQGYNLLLKPMLKVPYGTAKKRVVEMFKSAGSFFKTFKGIEKGAPALLKKVWEQAKQPLEFLTTLPEKIKGVVKALVYMRLESPTSTKNDAKIRAFFAQQVKALSGVFKHKFLAWVPKPAVDWLVKTGTEALAKLGTPPIRLIQFVRTKIKDAVGVVIRAVLRGVVNVDQALGKLRLPKWLVGILKQGADLLGRTMGTFGSFILNLSPQLKGVVQDVVGGLSDAADTFSDAMGAMLKMTAALGGDEVSFSGTHKKAYDDAVRKIRAPRGSAAHRGELRRIRAHLAAEQYRASFKLKRAKVEEAVDKILTAVGNAFAAVATPILEQLSGLLYIALSAQINAARSAVTALLRAIPEAGGILGGIFNVVSGVAVQLFVELVPKMVISVALDVIKEEIRDLKTVFMRIWDDPKERKLIERSQQAMAKFYEAFQVARKGLAGMKAGLDKGLASMLEGPVMRMLLKGLPPGLGQVIAAAASAALNKILGSASGSAKGGLKLNLDLGGILKSVLTEVREPMKTFLLANLPKGGGLTRALVQGFDRVWAAALQQDKISKLLSGNVIRNLLAEFIGGSRSGLVEFLSGQIQICGFRTGLDNVIKEVEKLVRSSNRVGEIFQGGLSGLIPVVVRLAHKPLAEFLSCQIESKRFKELLLPALDEAGAFFSEKANIDKLVKGGFPAALSVLLRVVALPIAGLLADGLGDPVLEGEIAESIRAASAELAQPGVVQRLAGKGLKGVLVDLARLARKPIVGWLSRRFPDPEFVGTLNKTYDALLRSPEQVARRGLKGLVEDLALPWARFAFKKAVDAFGGALGKGKDELLVFIASLRGAFPFVAELKTVVEVASEAGRARFVSAARPCADRLQTASAGALRGVVTCVLDAAKGAFKAGAAAGAKAAVVAAVEAVGQSVEAGKKALQELMKRYPFAGELAEVARLIAGVAADAGRTTFVAEGRRCAERVGSGAAASMAAIKATFRSVVSCLVAAAKSGLRAGAAAGVKRGNAAREGLSKPSSAAPMPARTSRPAPRAVTATVARRPAPVRAAAKRPTVARAKRPSGAGVAGAAKPQGAAAGATGVKRALLGVIDALGVSAGAGRAAVSGLIRAHPKDRVLRALYSTARYLARADGGGRAKFVAAGKGCAGAIDERQLATRSRTTVLWRAMRCILMAARKAVRRR